MKTPNDIIRFVEKTNGHALNKDEYITFGVQDIELTGVTVTWMATPESITAAADAGHNCIVHHEALILHPPGFVSGQEQEYRNWTVNTQRKNLLAEHGMTAIRIHGSADEMWGESEITWNNQPTDFTASPLATFQFGENPGAAGDTVSFSSQTLTDFINASTNQYVSFMIRTDDSQIPGGVAKFASKENEEFAHPALYVEASAIPEPSTLATLGGLLGMGLIGAWWQKRRKR